MDIKSRQRLIDKTEALIKESYLPAIQMVEFFEGNSDDRSMGRGIQNSRDIPISEYSEVFRSIRDRVDVQEIFIIINDLPDDTLPEERKRWPKAHIANIITSAAVTEIEKWIEQLEPRWIGEGWCYPGSKPPLSPSGLLPNIRPVCVELL